MSYLKSIPKQGVLLDVFQSFPDTAIPLLEYHEVLLRGPSPFSVAERELIAAYVSGLNACHYCHGVHKATAEKFGVSAGLIEDLLNDMSTADIDEKMKPVLHYVGKLTKTPSQISSADADTIFAAGWDDHALHDAVACCALFNMMNRLIEGLGIEADEDYFKLSADRLSSGGYAGLKKRLKKADEPNTMDH